MYYKVIIPIRPYLKKMIAYYKPVDPFEVTVGKDHYGGIFFNSFTAQSIPRDYNKYRVDQLTDQLTLLFNKKLTATNSFYLSEEKLMHIDQQLRDIFEEKLFSILDVATVYNTKSAGIKEIINRFMEMYDLDESDITHSALVKRYQRYRFRKIEDNKKINQRNLSDNDLIKSNLAI